MIVLYYRHGFNNVERHRLLYKYGLRYIDRCMLVPTVYRLSKNVSLLRTWFVELNYNDCAMKIL